MPRANKTLLNFSGGEISKKVQGRLELPVYAKGLDNVENFYCMAEGGLDYRTSTVFCKYTKDNKSATTFPFVFSDAQAYTLEFTDKALRFYFDDAAVLNSAVKTITAMTNAGPGLFTAVAHGLAVDDEVYLAGLSYLDNISGTFYKVNSVPSVDTFTLKDVFGTLIDTTAVGAYTTGGTIAKVYEVVTPYEERDLPFLQFAQSTDTMYITHRNYKPRKLIRSAHASWALNTYTITGDPFVSPGTVISGATQANPGVVTDASHGYVDGQLIFVTGVVGMTQLNSNFYVVRTITTNTFTLETRDGVQVDTTGYTAYSSGGVATTPSKYPRAVAFTDAGRLNMSGTFANPSTLFFSGAPSAGNTDYDNFTQGGTSPTNPITVTLGAVQGKADIIQWVASTSKQLIVGTFSTLRRVYGAAEATALSITDINAKPVNSFGVAQVMPTVNGDTLFYVQRASKKVRSMEYDISVDGYTTIDRTLVAPHLMVTGIRQLVEQQGTQDLIWAVLYTGELRALTYKQKEDISGWSKHEIAGTHINSSGAQRNFGKVLSMASVPRPTGEDRVWVCVERIINGRTIRSMEFLADPVNFPLRDDFFTYSDTEGQYLSGDQVLFENATYEAQKDCCHLDMSLFYDGTSIGLAAKAAISMPTVAVGDIVTVTATAGVFTAAMATASREIWKKYDENGNGGGRAVITAYTSPTQVTAKITVAFNNNTSIAAGNWFLTTAALTGLAHLEGQTVRVLADGATQPDVLVTAGKTTLAAQASKVRVGYGYVGVGTTLNIDMGGVTGPAAAKKRTVISLAFRLLNTLGLSFGTSKYRQEPIVFRVGGMKGARPPVPFSGIKRQGYTDGPDADNKQVTVIQSKPLSCTVLSIDVTANTQDEQES